MFKRDYFLQSLKDGLHLKKRWVLEAFSITRPGLPHPYEHGLIILPDGRYAMLSKDAADGHVVIEDAMPGQPLLRPLEKLLLKPGDIDNVYEPVVTCYGNALVNKLVLVYAFGNKYPFIEGPLKIRAIEKEILLRWTDDLPAEEAAKLPPLKQPILTSEYKRYNEAVGQLPGFNQLCVPSATRKTMTASPLMIKRRDELLEEHKDQLSDPVVLAGILKELTMMDREWMRGDPGERFYIKDKSYDVVRLKLFIMQGISQGFGVNGDLIVTSLDEGWDISKLPAMVNQLRDGSFSRGAQTALGGVEVKFNNRIFQNSVVVPNDCGSQLGLTTVMTSEKIPHYIGNYRVVKGVSTVLTEQILETLVGKRIDVRTPVYCRAEDANFCAVCMGDRISDTPQALGTYAAAIGSDMMSIFMSAMHGKSLKTVPLDMEAFLT